MRTPILVFAAFLLSACGHTSQRADPLSDAPEARAEARLTYTGPSSYVAALSQWRGVEDVNKWIGARFEYDTTRSMLLSETQRAGNGTLPIIAPADFFVRPRGVCVDLSRFAVETLREIAPATNPGYVMIEFDPVSVGGNTLRRHWVASFRANGAWYFFADSKRPGHIAGPYASMQDFVAEYARYRGRRIVAFRELASYERQSRTAAPRVERASQPSGAEAPKAPR